MRLVTDDDTNENPIAKQADRRGIVGKDSESVAWVVVGSILLWIGLCVVEIIRGMKG